MVVDKDVWAAEEEAEEAEERRDTESKTRTPHKDVGEKIDPVNILFTSQIDILEIA